MLGLYCLQHGRHLFLWTHLPRLARTSKLCHIMIFGIPLGKQLQKYLLLIMIILALVIRFGASFFLTDLAADPLHDPRLYVEAGWNLVSDNGFSVNGEIPAARRPPGYSFLLAGLFSIFGKSLVAARVVNILMSSLTVGLVNLLGCRLFNGGVGIIAGLISAFHPVFIRYSLRLYPDTFYTMLLSIILLIFIKMHERPDSLKLKLICGTLLGVATLTRSEFLFFISLLLVWALLTYRQMYTALRAFVIMLLPVILLVAPWVVRNYAVFGVPMISSDLGRTMWGVYNPDTFSDLNLMGGWYPPELGIRSASDVSREAQDPAYRYLPEVEWDKYLRQVALESIRQNARLLPKMAMYKLHRLIFTPGAVRDLLRFPLVYCFFLGLILLLVSGDRRFVVFYLLLLSAVCITLLFYTSERLRMGIEPTFIVIASYGLIEQIKFVKQRTNKNDTLNNDHRIGSGYA
jgi:4-amino-4-deoxy-L-arabinose transferase-like glycosyltransferase